MRFAVLECGQDRSRGVPRASVSETFVKLVFIIKARYSALVSAVDSSGKSIFAGKKATSFTNSEEIAVDKVKVSKRSTL